MIMYETKSWRPATITAVTVDRETETSGWIDGRRRAKNGSGNRYFDTWAEAKAHLLGEAQISWQRVDALLDDIKRLEAPND